VGDMVAAEALKNDWAGIVIWGAVRDTLALSKLDVGVMGLGKTPRKSVRRNEGQIGIDIRLGDVDIGTGDYLVADYDGALVFPKAGPSPF